MSQRGMEFTVGGKRRRSVGAQDAALPAPKRPRTTPGVLQNVHGHLERGPRFNVPVPKARAPGASLLQFVEAAEGSVEAESLEKAMAGAGFFSRAFAYSERARVDCLSWWTHISKGPGGPEATAVCTSRVICLRPLTSRVTVGESDNHASLRARYHVSRPLRRDPVTM